MAETFTKEYPSRGSAGAAAAHHRWLASLEAPVPDLLEATSEKLVFARVDGAHCHAADVPDVAALLGSLHAEAFKRELHAANLDTPFSTSNGVLLASFVEPRVAWLGRHRRSGAISERQYDVAVAMITQAARRPAAFYKDCNIRNVLMGNTSPVLVDFDDLTLAPFGYDLAKLLVSAAMTYGPLARSVYREALASYRQAVEERQGPVNPCTWEELDTWLEIHALFTRPYLGRNGYRHRWSSRGLITAPDEELGRQQT
ncbi:aminoglycoside phosphotransferase family protein [Nocardiopsis dassonvillei]|uniref:aminoglycoside phosphotransferase family protein n=1 Tax=Nocardiopsis dassonvillei TaxID=2014 RepID=UPI0036707DC3